MKAGANGCLKTFVFSGTNMESATKKEGATMNTGMSRQKKLKELKLDEEIHNQAGNKMSMENGIKLRTRRRQKDPKHPKSCELNEKIEFDGYEEP